MVHGREGSGKTWLVASWVADRLLRGVNSPPIVVWCGWGWFRDVGLATLLADLLAERTRAYGRPALERRVRGVGRPEGEGARDAAGAGWAQ